MLSSPSTKPVQRPKLQFCHSCEDLFVSFAVTVAQGCLLLAQHGMQLHLQKSVSRNPGNALLAWSRTAFVFAKRPVGFDLGDVFVRGIFFFPGVSIFSA